VPGFDLLAGLTACSEHMLGYGGHRAAAGLEVERGRVAALAQAFSEHAERVLQAEDLLPLEHVDAIVGGNQLGMALAEELQLLAPFGHGNPGVSLMLDDAVFRDCRAMGEGKHARFTVESGGARARAVAFGTGGGLPVQEGEPAEATFTLEVNEWGGVTEPRLVLRQARAAESPVSDVKAPVAAKPPILAELPLPVASPAAELPIPAEPPEVAPEPERELVLFALP
jgi:single-stranded-DNA-specific exonuclease